MDLFIEFTSWQVIPEQPFVFHTVTVEIIEHNAPYIYPKGIFES